MPVFVALLRAVNVGGTGKLPMSELVAMATAAGFRRPRTWIASGNLVLESPGTESQVKALRLPAAAAGTSRNLNTVARLAAMARE